VVSLAAAPRRGVLSGYYIAPRLPPGQAHSPSHSGSFLDWHGLVGPEQNPGIPSGSLFKRFLRLFFDNACRKELIHLAHEEPLIPKIQTSLFNRP
jgi:hypothetical protein